MRLIDGDKLFNTVIEKEMWNVPDFVYESIQKAPTVNAIPIEFIEKIIGQYNDWNEDVEPLLKLLEDWEKENAQRENSSPEL